MTAVSENKAGGTLAEDRFCMRPTSKGAVVRAVLVVLGSACFVFVVANGLSLYREIYQRHHYMVHVLPNLHTEIEVLRYLGRPQRILSTNNELSEALGEGSYVYARLGEGTYVYARPFPRLEQNGRVYLYQSAFNSRILVFIDANGHVLQVLVGHT